MNKTNKDKRNIFDNFLEKFYPTYIFEKVEDISYEFLKKENIKLIILDLDNTLINKYGIYTKKLEEWIKDIKSKNIMLYILSNSYSEKKVKNIASELKIKYKSKASKPSVKNFEKIIEETKEKKENTLMIGDQIFTDVFGGNKTGIKTIIVTPIAKNENLISKIKRPFEKIVLKYYMNQKGD